MEHERVLTVPETARLLRVHPETVREWLRTGELQGAKLGVGKGIWRVPMREIERLLGGSLASPCGAG